MSYEELAVSQQAGLIMQGRDRLYRGRRQNTTVLFMENRLVIKISVLRLTITGVKEKAFIIGSLWGSDLLQCAPFILLVFVRCEFFPLNY
jgi:hypothetical protein